MDAPDLMQRLADAITAVAGLTALGCVAGVLLPGLASSTAPHPALAGSFSNFATIVETNLRIVLAPFLLAVLRVDRAKTTRTLGDLLIAGLTAASTINVGVELGRWQGQLLPYIPQLPIELTALAVGVAAWLVIRAGERSGRMLVALAGACAALVGAAGAVETWWTPHRQPTVAIAAVDHSPSVSARREGLIAGADVRRLGPTAARSHAPFPSRSSVPPRPPAAVFSFINQPTPTPKEPPPR
jgi:hypothetical protein